MGNLRDIKPDTFTTLEEFDEAIDFVNAECTYIEQQILEAKGERLIHGEFSDPEWFSRATSAKKIARALKQKLAKKRADLSRDLKRQEQAKLDLVRERAFVTACRQILPKDQYLAIWKLVDENSH